MSRHAREVLPDTPHHITTRGNNRRRLFSRPSDYRRFLSILAFQVRRVECVVHQVTLMVNHVHLIATPASARALSSLMKIVCQRYAQFRNWKRGATGKLFEQRFYSEAILSERHLAAATLYCDSNAYRAGSVVRPEQHRWSTCALHIGRPEASEVSQLIWTPSSWYLSLGDSPVVRARVYAEMLHEYVTATDEAAGVPRSARDFEAAASASYSRRLERPDRSVAREESGVALYQARADLPRGRRYGPNKIA